jgi:ATP-dependent DNA helicase RecG
MRSIGMIDSAGFGIREMFQQQRKRFLPLPDYEKSSSNQVVLTIYGQEIDENYSRMLMERTDLPIERVVWLDRVQKNLKISDSQAATLRRTQLIEGRRPNYFVSANVADATDTRPEYTRNKGLDDHYYKSLILKHIRQFKSASASEIRALLIDKLPDSLSAEQKLIKIKNLLAGLRQTGMSGTKIITVGAGKAARWHISDDSVIG